MKTALKIVVLTIPLYGHVNPMMGVVKGLVDEGHDVVVYCVDEFKKVVEDAGATYKTAEGFQYLDRFSPEVGKDPIKLADLLLGFTEDQIDDVIQSLTAEKADVVLHDGFCLWGKLAANALGIPAVGVISTVVLAPPLLLAFPGIAWSEATRGFANLSAGWHVMRRYGRLLERFGIKNDSIFDLFVNQEPLNIVCTSRYFQPSEKSIPENFLFIGPSVAARVHTEKEKLTFENDQPLVYISLGTIFNNDPQFYHLCIAAFTGAPYNVIISVGKSTDLKVFCNLPENIQVRNHVKQLAVLQQAAVFISHGGMNSVNESMYFGVPMILFPAVQEQLINSSRVQQLGAGVVMKRDDLSKDGLLGVVERLVKEPGFVKNAAEVQRSMKEAPGIAAAVKRIEGMVE